MLKNYIKIVIRNILKNKGYSFINITGLAIGMACCILIFLWVQHELSFNRYHNNADQIYRVNKSYNIGTQTDYNYSTPYPLAQAINDKFVGILNATNFFRSPSLLSYGDMKFNESRVCFTNQSMFEIFTFQFIKGNPEAALANPNSIVLTRSMAHKYFGETDPVGKTIIRNNRDELAVTAIIEDLPTNSDFRYDCFIPVEVAAAPGYEENWDRHFFHTYVLLRKNTNTAELELKLSQVIQAQLPEEKISLKLQALKQIHLYEISGKMSGMKNIYFYSIIALFILIIACINFINLSTARSTKRAKEIGLRKVIGAERIQIIRQFYGESIVFVMIAAFFSLAIAGFILPLFNEFTGKELNLSFQNINFIAGFIVMIILTGLLAGSYPALLLSSFQPVSVLKGTMGKLASGVSFRRVLVIFQFSLAIMLMIGASVIFSQIKYMKNKQLGYKTENILNVRLNRDISENYDAFKNELLQYPEIAGMTRTLEPPTAIYAITRGITWEGKDTEGGAAFGLVAIDYDYIETLNLEIVRGRNFSKQFPQDSINYIFNEKAIAVMGIKDPIGKRLSSDEDNPGIIVGVVKDFNSLPLRHEIEPLMMVLVPQLYRRILIKIQPHNIQETIQTIERTWQAFSPAYPFESRFLDEDFDELYTNEIRIEKLFRYFVILAIFISCLGLLGLASFINEQRTKEIGIRKVLGASTHGLIVMLSKEFSKWVLFANLIAFPVAFFAMSNWLQNYAYRIELTIWPFLFAGFSALVIALLTVSYQAVRAAMANPVKSLRSE